MGAESIHFAGRVIHGNSIHMSHFLNLLAFLADVARGGGQRERQISRPSATEVQLVICPLGGLPVTLHTDNGLGVSSEK